MIKWYELEEKAACFVYYPLLEMAVGIFLMICALAVPILFLVYNGIKVEQWGELLFCFLFFVLFLFTICLSANAQTIVEGRYIVRFVPESAALRQATRAQTIEAKQEALKKNIDSLTNIIKSPTIKNLAPLWLSLIHI